MTGIVLGVLGVLASAAYMSALLALIADEVVEKSAALARMVSGVADLNPGEVRVPGPVDNHRARDIAAQTIAPVNQLTNQEVIA